MKIRDYKKWKKVKFGELAPCRHNWRPEKTDTGNHEARRCRNCDRYQERHIHLVRDAAVLDPVTCTTVVEQRRYIRMYSNTGGKWIRIEDELPWQDVFKHKPYDEEKMREYNRRARAQMLAAQRPAGSGGMGLLGGSLGGMFR